MEKRNKEQDYSERSKERGGRRAAATWNKWRKGLFEGHHVQFEQSWRSIVSVKWDAITSGKWIQKATWNRMVTASERDQFHKTPVTSTWTSDFLTREGLLQSNAGTFPCESHLPKWGKHPVSVYRLQAPAATGAHNV